MLKFKFRREFVLTLKIMKNIFFLIYFPLFKTFTNRNWIKEKLPNEFLNMSNPSCDLLNAVNLRPPLRFVALTLFSSKPTNIHCRM